MNHLLAVNWLHKGAKNATIAHMNLGKGAAALVAFAAAVTMSACGNEGGSTTTSTDASQVSSVSDASAPQPQESGIPGTGLPSDPPPPADPQGVESCGSYATEWGSLKDGVQAMVGYLAFNDFDSMEQTPFTATLVKRDGDTSEPTNVEDTEEFRAFDFNINPKFVKEILIKGPKRTCYVQPDPDTAAKFPDLIGIGKP